MSSLCENHYRSLSYKESHFFGPSPVFLFYCSVKKARCASRGRPLTINGVTLLFARIRKRAGITGKRISPHIFRHTFAIRYLVLGNDPFSLQELLGHEDMTTVKNYMHMNDETIQEQKRKYSPGDHLPTRMPGPKETRRKGYRTKEQRRTSRGNNEA